MRGGVGGVGGEGPTSGCIIFICMVSSSILIEFSNRFDFLSLIFGCGICSSLSVYRIGPVPYLRGFCGVALCTKVTERGPEREPAIILISIQKICRPRIKRRVSQLCPRIRWYQPPSRKGWSEGRGMSEPGWRRAHLPASSWHEVAVPPARSLLPLGAGSAWVLRGHDVRWIWRMCWRSNAKRPR